MAETLNKKGVEFWQTRLRHSHAIHEKHVEKNLELWRDYYRGQQWKDRVWKSSYRDHTVENMVFNNISIIRPSININNPRIFANPRKKPWKMEDGTVFDTNRAAFIWELMMNYYYRHLRIKRQVDKCLTDALIGHWGLMRIGFTMETEKINKEGEEIEIHEMIKSQSPFAVRVSPLDFRKDPFGMDHNLDDHEWIAFRWVRNLEDIKENPRFKNTRNLKANFNPEIDDKKPRTLNMDVSSGSGRDSTEKVEGWDIYDKKRHEKITIVETHEKPLFHGDWEIKVDGFPVETLYFNENPDAPYPLSDVQIYIDAQNELNQINSMRLAHIKRISQRKYVGRRSSWTMPGELAKITEGPDGAVALTEGDPSSALIPLRDAGISQDIYIVGDRIKAGIQQVAGVAAFESGGAQKADSAAEINLVNQGLSARRQERTLIIEDFIVRIVRKMSKIIQQTTLDQVDIPLDNQQQQLIQDQVMKNSTRLPGKIFEILGEDGEILLPWLTVDPEDIIGDYEFQVQVGSTTPKNQETRKRDAQLIKNVAAQSRNFNQMEVDKWYLEQFEINESERLFKTPQQIQQEQQQAQQAQQAAQQAEIQKDQQKRQTDLQKTIAKTQTAKEIQSKKSETSIIETLLNSKDL